MSYKTDCPIPTCNSNDFYVTPENGIGYCFHCGYWTRDINAPIIEKTRSEYIDTIRQYYKKMTEYYHSSITANARKYINSRGITDDSIDLYNIGYCPIENSLLYKNKIAEESGLAKNGRAFLGGRITFPYYKDHDIVTDIRGRSLDDSLRYLSPLHSTYYRGADYPFNNVVNTYNAKTVIITEGEIKSIVATQAGFTTVGLPGMVVWRDGFTVMPDTKYIILFDSQRKNSQHVNIAIMKIAKHFESPYIVSLPLVGDKMDIDTFILSYGAEAFGSILDTAISYDTWYKLQRRF